MNDDLRLTCGEAARILKVAPRTIRKWVDHGNLPATDKMISKSDLREFLVKHGFPTEELDEMTN